MKSFLNRTILAIAMLGLATAALAQVYPYTNPTYTPTAQLAAQSFSTTGTYSFVTNGVSTASLRVTGTCTGLVAAPQITNDGTNWTTVPAYPVGAGGVPVVSITGTGFWKFNTSGAVKARLNITALSAACSVAMAATPGAAPEAFVGDPCQVASIPKSAAAVNIGSATTTNVIAKAAGKVTYVCSFVASAAGTNPTVLFKYGTLTSTACDTGAVSLTGTFAPTAGTVLALGQGDGTVFQSATNTDICVTTGGTPSVQGVINYVQQ